MTPALLAAFLALHGVIHVPVWLVHPTAEPEASPFDPGHSTLLTATRVPETFSHRTAVALAVWASLAYVAAALGVALGTWWAVPVAFTAAGLGLALKLLFFNPWLVAGIALDLLVLAAAAWEWPLALV